MKLKQILTSCVLLLLPVIGAAQVPLNQIPSLALGQSPEIPATDVKSDGPNWVEGRELDSPQSVAADLSSGALYVADTGNNRVLGWHDGRSFANGARADIVIGQRDFRSNFPRGPGTPLSSGLSRPTTVAVDAAGNLYVVDAGNNRILRYARPFEQVTDLKLPDLVIGQPSLSGKAAGIGADRIDTTAGNAVYRTALVFNGQGDLYFSDAGNHRVLRYPVAVLGEGAENGPDADMVIGQPDFDTNVALSRNTASREEKSGLREPAGLALDASGRLYVTDALNRVLVWEPPFVRRQAASRIMGIVKPGVGQPIPDPINATSLGFIFGNQWYPPEGVFTIGDVPFVIDTYVHRILRYAPFDEWTDEELVFSPPAEAVIGQPTIDSDTVNPNRALAEPRSDSFLGPVHAMFAFDQVYVTDSGNNRVLAFPDLSTGPPTADGPPYEAQRVLGQVGFEFRATNLIEGREFQFAVGAAGIAFDTSSDPPRLYVADTGNNRVLGFADARKVRPGDIADLVIGQPGFRRSVVNWPGGFTDTQNDTGLDSPAGVAVDADGNLFVADSGNARVLRFPKPFDQAQNLPTADLVLGQFSFVAKIMDPTDRTMAFPRGLAFTQEGWLAVSDSAHNRLLLFQPPFTNGMAAAKVFGQPDFGSTDSGNAGNRLNGPLDISTDTDDRLYVCDSGNRRVQVFSRVVAAGPDPSAVLTLPDLRSPQGVYVSWLTGEIWVAERDRSRALRYPKFDTLFTQGVAWDLAISGAWPLAVAQDGFGNLFFADSLSRIMIHFPGLVPTSAADFQIRLAPGMITSLWIPDISSIEMKSFDELPDPVPLPTVLSDVQVLVDGQPAPIYFVSPMQINFLMPNDAPTSGLVEAQVLRPSTLQILAASQVQMGVASPAFFTIPPVGTGQIAALNQDYSVNSPTNPAKVGEVVMLFGTGAGHIPGAPPDGEMASGLTPTPVLPRVFVNSRFIEGADNIPYSGLAPGLVGVWQINIKIPDFVPPGNIVIIILMNDVPSGDPNTPGRIVTTIAVEH